MRKIVYFLLFTVVLSCKSTVKTGVIPQEKKAINLVLNNWHKAASEANFEAYFNAMDSEGIFIGTDATENWTIQAFKDFSKPYFEKEKAWSFTTINRNIFLNKDQNTAWFDELLDTWMGTCRGSGVLEKENKQWKIKHYVLSITIPNDAIQNVIPLKKMQDSILLLKK